MEINVSHLLTPKSMLSTKFHCIMFCFCMRSTPQIMSYELLYSAKILSHKHEALYNSVEIIHAVDRVYNLGRYPPTIWGTRNLKMIYDATKALR